MSRTYAELKRAVGVNLQKAEGTIGSSDFDMSMNLAMDSLRQLVDFPETHKIARLTPALFADVFTYAIPTDLWSDQILDIRPLTELPNTHWKNDWQRRTSTDFNVNLLGDDVRNTYTIEYDNGTRTLRLNAQMWPPTRNVTLNDCDAYDVNGTWTADATGSDATNIQTSLATYFEGTGAVSLDVDVSQSANNYATAYVNLATTSDVSDMVGPYLLFYIYIPDVTHVTSVTSVIGSGSALTPSTKADYRTFTATTQFDGSALVSGKNVIGVPWSSSVETGTLDTTAVSYLECKLSYSAAQADMAGVIIDMFVLREGVQYELSYVTKNIVQTATGAKQQYFTADDDTLLLSPEGEMVYIAYATAQIAPKVRSLDEATWFQNIANTEVTRYQALYPSIRKKIRRNWYY